MEVSKRILVIDFCNFEDYPVGGYVTFVKSLMSSFLNELALIGITTDKKDPIGKWFRKNINGIEYDYFALALYDKSKTKHILPDRLVSYFLFKFFKKRILQKNIPNVFIQRAEILIATRQFQFKNVCFCFAGLENPLSFSKYWYSRYIAKFFDKVFFLNLDSVKLILASGDEGAINDMISRSKGRIKRASVIKFPTRINTQIFKPINKKEARFNLGFPDATTIIVTTGRLAWFKGWKFMIDSFEEFQKKNPKSLFYFIGEGEDLGKIKSYLAAKGLQAKVMLIGKKTQSEIAVFLNAADLFIMGSYKEGWSTTLLEALACGIPICSTNFSSANEIVTEGVNGFVEEHDVLKFAQKMDKALLLNMHSINICSYIQKYAVSELKSDLLNYWKLI